jgi:hypothetical protein
MYIDVYLYVYMHIVYICTCKNVDEYPAHDLQWQCICGGSRTHTGPRNWRRICEIVRSIHTEDMIFFDLGFQVVLYCG